MKKILLFFNLILIFGCEDSRQNYIDNGLQYGHTDSVRKYVRTKHYPYYYFYWMHIYRPTYLEHENYVHAIQAQEDMQDRTASGESEGRSSERDGFGSHSGGGACE